MDPSIDRRGTSFNVPRSLRRLTRRMLRQCSPTRALLGELDPRNCARGQKKRRVRPALGVIRHALGGRKNLVHGIVRTRRAAGRAVARRRRVADRRRDDGAGRHWLGRAVPGHGVTAAGIRQGFLVLDLVRCRRLRARSRDGEPRLRFLRPLLTRQSRSRLLVPRLDRLAVRPSNANFRVRLTLKPVLGGGRRPLLLLLRLRRLHLRRHGRLILRRRYLADRRRGIRLLHIVVRRFLAYQPVRGHGALTLRIVTRTRDYAMLERVDTTQLILRAVSKVLA